MILVTSINKNNTFYINETKIEMISETPDTLITLESGKNINVHESAQEIIDMINAEKVMFVRAK